MKKKKIFIYIHQCILKGGVEKVFSNLLNNLPEDTYDITVLSHIAYLTDDIHAHIYPEYVRRRWLYYDEFSHNKVKRLFQRIHNFIMPRLYPRLLKLKNFNTAIAAQEGLYADFVSTYARAEKNLVWIHNDMSKCHWTKNYFGSIECEKKCYRSFTNVVCVSEAVANSMEQLFGTMDNLCVCYNPIDTAEIDLKCDAFTVTRDESPLFLAVGRLAEQKGFDRLLSVCRRLNQKGYIYQMWIIGEGEKRKELEEILSRGNLNNVKLLGAQSNPYVYMKAADWLLCTSRHEGFNMVLYEAMWCGTPIISMDNAGTRELLGDSEYGIVTENNEEAFYTAMCTVLDDSTKQDYYRKKVQERRSFIDLKERIEKIIKVL